MYNIKNKNAEIVDEKNELWHANFGVIVSLDLTKNTTNNKGNQICLVFVIKISVFSEIIFFGNCFEQIGL